MPWGNDAKGWELVGLKKALTEAQLANKKAAEALEAAAKLPTHGSKGKGKGKGKEGTSNKGAGKGDLKSGDWWLCKDPDCLKNLKKGNPQRGPYCNPLTAKQCLHCLAH